MSLPIKRRLLTGAVGAVALSVTLAGCGGSSDGGNGDGGGSDGDSEVSSLRVVDYYNNEPDNEIYQAALEQCGEEIGVTIERETIPGSDLIAKVLQMSSSKTLPDVLMLDNPDMAQIAETGALIPLSEFGLSAEGEADGVIEAGSYDGEVYGLQPVTNTIAIFYNVDVFEAAGLEPPTSWDELKSTAAALTEGSQYGIAFSAPANYEGTWQFLPFMWTAGANEDDLNSPQMIEALQLWVDLVDSGSASESVVTWTQADVNDQFIAGNAAMMVNGPWQIPVLNDNPDVNWAVAPIPTPDGTGEAVAPLGGEVWTVPNTGDEAKQAAAAQIVECLNTDESQLSLALQRQTVPTKTAVQEEFLQEDPSMEAFSTMVQTARARTGILGAQWPDAATQIYEAIQLSLVGGKTPAEAVEQVTNG